MRGFRSVLIRTAPILVLLISSFFIAFVIMFGINWWYDEESATLSSNGPSLPLDVKLMMPQLLEQLTWNEGENVLDYGCGNGAVGYHMILPNVRKHNGHQYSLEYSPQNLERAAKSFPDERITYAVGNLLGKNATKEFPFKDVVFDKIFAIYVFHLFHNLDRLLSRFRDILRPSSGQIAFTTLTANNILFQIASAISKKDDWEEYLQDYQNTFHPSWSTDAANGDMGITKLKRFFSNAGFRVKFLKVDRATMRSKSVDKFLDGSLWLTPIFEKVPISLVADLALEIRQQFTNITGLPANTENFYLDHKYIIGILEVA